ncbi:hypothetical protein ONS95_011633 [Cadophora gregata]|uniref:uncharacterized protein n=1 Tax=Cadophora gregata TaxID=51156 RepID=UPI0026DDBD96|nr:uncharacterized protein ONS95_011633 [Cadophora gregata]KAK0120227.1 hypothetical protein ONS95_011633 [Cadophora gregata]KAK0121262.1 hypothetical protein ONS96_011437 [Cadophora gregata f. sp. sojae]
MAEALGVAARVAGLITIADIVVRRGYEFIKLVKDAGETVEKVICEVNWLLGMLHSLQNVARRLEGDARTLDPTMQIKWIEPCYQTLSKIQSHQEKAMAGDTMTRMEKIKWPLRQSATRELLEEIERHKSNIALAMNAKEMSALCDIRDGVHCLKRAFDSHRIVQNQIVLNDERRKMLQILGDINARKWQDSNIRLRQPGTGIWFTNGAELKEWLSRERSKLWINGIPGAGKTVLMSSTIQKIESELKTTEALAFFYCDYKDSSTHSASTILGCLARQLIMRLEDCFDDLTSFYEEHITPDRSIRTPSPEECCKLISKLSTRFETVMLVVDGLDEITDGRAEVTRLLASLQASSSSIKALFSSRPEIDIGHVLQDFQTISIAAQSSDIRLYIASEIERRTTDMRLEIGDPNLKEHIMKTIAERCDGMFRWVSCPMDYLCECSNDRDRRDALRKLPPDLPSSYERILERVNRSTKENQTLVREALHWITYGHDADVGVADVGVADVGVALTNTDLLQALAVRQGDTTFDSRQITTEKQLLYWCSSLVRKNPISGLLELAHFTVEEFLQSIDPVGSPGFAQYQLSGDHSIMARTCIRVLGFEEFDGATFPYVPGKAHDTDSIDLFCAKYPFLKYAALIWPYHVHKSDPKEIEQALLELFTIKTGRTFQEMAVVWHYCSYDYRLRQAERAGICAETIGFQADDLDPSKLAENNMWPSPLHWAAYFSLPDVCTMFIDNGDDINRQCISGTPLHCCMMSCLEDRDRDRMTNAWFDIVACFRGINGDDDYQPQLTVFKALLQAGACPNIPSSPDQVQSPLDRLDLAIQIAFDIVGKPRYLYLASLLIRSGARLSADNLDDLISLRDVDELFSTLIEAAIRAKWRSWSYEHIANILCTYFNPDWLYSADHIESLRVAVGESFQDETPPELQMILDSEDGQISQLPRVVLKTIELSCQTSEAFNHKMWSVLAEMLTMNESCIRACFLLLSLCPGIDVELHDETTGKSLLLMCLDAGLDFRDAREMPYFVELLLHRGASVTSLDEDGMSALDIAAQYWQVEMFAILWRSKSFVESRNTSQEMVNWIFYEAMSGSNGRLTVFLMKEMAICSQPDCISFLTFALGQDESDIVSQIIADYEKVPELWAVALSSLLLASRPEVSFPTFELLLGTWRFPVSQDKFGNTPFHHLVSMHDDTSRAKLQLLIETHRSLDDINEDGMTPLALAVRCKNLAATEMLLEAGANANLILAREQTALHLAACLGNTEAVEMLLERTYNHKVEDDSGMNPGQLALACGHDHIAAMIRIAIKDEGEMNDRDVTNSPGQRVSGLSDSEDPHGKLPLRLLDCNSKHLIPPDDNVADPTESIPSRPSCEDIRGSESTTPEISIERFQGEAISSTYNGSSGMDILANERRFTLKRQFQNIDSASREQAGKKFRQA